jgi:hypothetical protein
LSLFLFDLVANVFHRILNKAQAAGKIRGLGSFGSLQHVLNLHFAYDTLLFLEATVENFQTLKWILLGYEHISGLKFNFNKSELVALNLEDEYSANLANLLGCKVSKLPLMYLGMPLH